LILGPIWAIGILVVIGLALFASVWIVGKLRGPRSSWTSPSSIDKVLPLFLFPGVAALFVYAWFKVGYYGSVILGTLGL
jgi:hypothetical protein